MDQDIKLFIDSLLKNIPENFKKEIFDNVNKKFKDAILGKTSSSHYELKSTENLKYCNEYFNEKTRDKVLKWLEKKWTEKKQCEICNVNEWMIAPGLIMMISLFDYDNSFLRMLEDASIKITSERSYPKVALVCKNCGNSKFFNANVMNIC